MHLRIWQRCSPESSYPWEGPVVFMDTKPCTQTELDPTNTLMLDLTWTLTQLENTVTYSNGNAFGAIC